MLIRVRIATNKGITRLSSNYAVSPLFEAAGRPALECAGVSFNPGLKDTAQAVNIQPCHKGLSAQLSHKYDNQCPDIHTLNQEGARFHLIGSKRKKKGFNLQWEIQIWPQGDWVGAIVELRYLKELFSRDKIHVAQCFHFNIK